MWYAWAMEKTEISVHEVRVYLALIRSNQWMSAKEIADAAKVAQRTARAHAHKLAKLGLLDTAEIFPGHRYRMSQHASKRNAAYVARLNAAVDVVGDSR